MYLELFDPHLSNYPCYELRYRAIYLCLRYFQGERERESERESNTACAARRDIIGRRYVISAVLYGLVNGLSKT